MKKKILGAIDIISDTMKTSCGDIIVYFFLFQESSISEQEMQEMKKVVESERSARTDLEMYVAVLNTQKGVLQEDTDKLKRELHNGL